MVFVLVGPAVVFSLTPKQTFLNESLIGILQFLLASFMSAIKSRSPLVAKDSALLGFMYSKKSPTESFLSYLFPGTLERDLFNGSTCIKG
jgi:hypothetical protein